MELVRGMVIARSAERNGIGAAGGHVKIPSIVAGDVVRAYGNGARIATTTYDGRPAIGGACDGRSSFTVTRSESARPPGSASTVSACCGRTRAPTRSPFRRRCGRARRAVHHHVRTTERSHHLPHRRRVRAATMPPPPRSTERRLRRHAARGSWHRRDGCARRGSGAAWRLRSASSGPGSVRYRFPRPCAPFSQHDDRGRRRRPEGGGFRSAPHHTQLTLITTFAPARADAKVSVARTSISALAAPST